jgi:hypothetical protein
MALILRRVLASKLTWLIILAAVAASLRTTAVEWTVVDRPLRADALEYFLTGYNLRRNGIYSRSPGLLVNPPAKVEPDAYRPPGLPLLIGPAPATFSNGCRL